MSRIICRITSGAAILLLAALPPGPLAAADLAPWSLSLEDAVARGLESNLDVALARTQPRQSYLNVVLGQAAFDPALSGSASHSENTSEPSSTFSTTESTTDQGTIGIGGEVDFGLTYDASLFHRDDSSTLASAAFQQIPDSFTSGITVNLRQPLLRGAGREVNRTTIVLAQRNLEISESRLEQSLLDTVRDTENAYWDLLTAIKSLEVQQKSLKRARDLYELNKTKVEVGTLAQIEITTAEAEVAAREQDVIVAEQTIEDAEDALKALMNVPPESREWERRIVPTDTPEFSPTAVDLEKAVARARDRRTDLREARLTVQNRETEASQSRNTMKHQLDVVGSYTSTGNNFDREFVFVPADLDGDGTVAPGEGFDDIMDQTQSRSESFSEIADTVNQNWSLRLEWSYPLGNRAARAEYSRRRIAVDQAELSLLKVEQAVLIDVRRAVRSVRTDAKRVEAARANVRLQEKKVEAEQKKYENGMSTSFEVLTFQNDLASAESGLISAFSDYVKSQTGLAHSTGSLLEERGIRFEAAGDYEDAYP